MKKKHKHPKSERAFTRLELAVVLATLVLLAGIALPILGNTKPSSERVSCLSNLRQIGQAIHLWGNEHDDRTPWFTPVSEGGTMVLPNSPPPGVVGILRNNAWFQMAFLSNQLVTPRVLVCPSDQGVGIPRKMANDFSSSGANGGLMTPGFKNASVSYVIGLHATFESSRGIVSGDRNVKYDQSSAGCALGYDLFETINVLTTPTVIWTNAIHGLTGNLLFSDGGVEQLSTTGLQRAAGDRNQGDGGAHHFLVPN